MQRDFLKRVGLAGPPFLLGMAFSLTGITPFPDLMESVGRCLASRRQRYVAPDSISSACRHSAEPYRKALMPGHNAVQAPRRRIGHLIPDRAGLEIADRNVGESPRHVTPPRACVTPVPAPAPTCDARAPALHSRYPGSCGVTFPPCLGVSGSVLDNAGQRTKRQPENRCQPLVSCGFVVWVCR